MVAPALKNRANVGQVLVELLRLAWPMVFAHVAFLGMILTDTLIAGRFSPEALAGVSLGAAVILPGYNLLMGMSLAIAPAVSRLLGEKIPRHQLSAWVGGVAGRVLGLWVLLFGLVQLAANPLSALIAPDSIVEREMQGYLHLSAGGLPFMGLFFLLRNIFEAHSVSRPIMWWGLAALPINGLLDWVFVHGIGPFPSLGAAGCGAATALVQAFLGLGLLATFVQHRATRGLKPFHWRHADANLRGWARDGARGFLRMGFPVGMSLLAESSLFALGGLLMARYGTAAVGAHQVSVTIAALAFVMQVAIGQATAVLLGRSLGAQDFVLLRQTAGVGVAVGLVLALVISAVFYGGRFTIPAWFTADSEVQSYAAVFMVWAALFHLADAMQAIHAGALRGIHATADIMRITLPAYWLLSLPLMLWLTLVADAPASGIWWAFSAGLLAAALLLIARFWWRLRRCEGL